VAQYRLPAAADAALKSALLLLKIRYPNGTATVNGYTDDVPVPGGNVALSWKRADAVVAWLIQHGIASERLLAVGHGAADPEFPDRPGGQPRNRRVVIVILPGS
jgi:outer membrane protein OmpA-like peptidoglycan-associated protein